MHRGQIVKVTEAFAGQQLKRVVSSDERYVFICREEEFHAANRESREPNSIGFPREFVQEVKDESRQGSIR